MIITVYNSRGFYHIKLNEASSFLTPLGTCRLIRMPIGLTVAGDALQHKLDKLFSNPDRYC